MTCPWTSTRSIRLVQLLATAALTVLLPRSAAADEVLVRNGDRLSGDVIRQEKGRLRLETTYAGTVEIAWKDVREVRFDEPGQVLLDDETVLTVTVLTREGDQLTLRPEGPAPGRRVRRERSRRSSSPRGGAATWRGAPAPILYPNGYSRSGGVTRSIHSPYAPSEYSTLP